MPHSNSNNINDSLAHLTAKVRRAYSNYLNQSFARAQIEINTQQLVILFILWDKNGQRQQDIADQTSRDKTSIARLLTTMEKRNLIVRKPDEEDSRQKLVYLTENGKNIKDKVFIQIKNYVDSVQRNIDPKDLKICKNVLNTVYKNLVV